MRYAIVDPVAGIIVNVVEYDDPPDNPPPGYDDPIIAVQNDDVSMNWLFDGTTVVPPQPLLIINPSLDTKPAKTAAEILGAKP